MRWFTRHGFRIAASVLACASTTGFAQSDSGAGRLRGRVIDANTTRPLFSVVVVLTHGTDTLGRAQTDSTGTFALSVRPVLDGGAVAHFALAGYRADSLSANATGPALRVAMSPVSARTMASLGPTKVLAAIGTSDFDRRAAKHAGGVFITEQEIEKRQPIRTSDLFKSIIGVSVRDSGGITQLVSNRGVQPSFSGSTVNAGSAGRAATNPTAGRGAPALPTFDDGSRGPTVDGRKCVLRVGVDGLLMDASFSVDQIPVSAVHGIEAYLGAATIPVEFSTVSPDSPCGIVMIWTRNGPRRAP